MALFQVDSKYMPWGDKFGQINRYGSWTTTTVQQVHIPGRKNGVKKAACFAAVR